AKLSGKTVLLSITAGAPEAAYQRGGFTGHTVFELLTPLAVTAKACSMIFAEPVVSYGYSVPAAQNDKENYLANARKHAQALSAQLKAL
ncbi:NAD(P)H-dependent oxidoreductase, partial [Sutterella wadsworthensis]